MRSIALVSMLISGIAVADTITLNGRTYEDVLVYETSRSYYVCIPEQGTSIRASRDEVDPSTVSIVKDAVYRSERQSVYQDVKNGGRPTAAPDVSIDPNAPTVIEGNSNSAMPSGMAESNAGGAVASGSGLGVSLEVLQSNMKGAGITFSESGPGQWSAQNEKGNFQIIASGAAENLGSIQLSANGTIQELQGLLSNMNAGMATAAPWIPDVMPEVQQQLQGMVLSGRNEPIVVEREGVRLQIQAAMNQGAISIQASVAAI